MGSETQENSLDAEAYCGQVARWPSKGKHILANFDADSIVVYQAYRADIATFAIENGHFGGEFSYNRMSWIKPNFLWMMYRSGWGTKPGQEVVLALRLNRTFFDRILAGAVASSFEQSGYATHADWQAAVQSSDVRLQWDPDHDPLGKAVDRRAIQLGLRGEMLEEFGKRELLDVIDMSEFVSAQRALLQGGGLSAIRTPVENAYRPASEDAARRLKLD